MNLKDIAIFPADGLSYRPPDKLPLNAYPDGRVRNLYNLMKKDPTKTCALPIDKSWLRAWLQAYLT